MQEGRPESTSVLCGELRDHLLKLSDALDAGPGVEARGFEGELEVADSFGGAAEGSGGLLGHLARGGRVERGVVELLLEAVDRRAQGIVGGGRLV